MVILNEIIHSVVEEKTMIQESLKIKNFGPLKNVVMENIRPVMVLLGRSGSGKSLILKILAMMRHVCKKQFIRRAWNLSGMTKTSFRIRKDSYLRFADVEHLVKSDTSIHYSIVLEGVQCHINFEDGKFSVKVIGANSTIGPFLKVAFISDMRNLLASWAKKGASVQSKVLDNYFAETFSLWEEALDAKSSSEQSIDYLNASFQINKSDVGGRRELVITDGRGRKTFFSRCASGERSSIPVGIILRYLTRSYDYRSAIQKSYLSDLIDFLFEKSQRSKGIDSDKMNMAMFEKMYLCVHVEEPELSLDPNTQLRFAEELIEVMSCAKERLESSIIFTTHSPYWVTALNAIAAERKHKFLSWDRLGGYIVTEEGTVSDLRDNDSQLLMTPNMDEASVTIDEKYNSVLEKIGDVV